MFDFPNSPTIGQSYSPSAGITYQWDGQAWVSAGLLATAAMIERIYTSVGTATWTKPAGLAYAEVEGTGPGGSGSAAIATAASTYSLGAGGGAGAWGERLFSADELPASVTITNGAPGAASSGPGNAGGTSSFGSLITLPGGSGGQQGSNTTSNGSALTGVSSPPTGVSIGGVGGGSDYTQVNFAGISIMGRSGFNKYGSPSAALIVLAASSASGLAGFGYGSGSSGGVNGPSQTLKASVAGQPGFFRVREFYTQPAGVLPGIVTPWVAYTPTFTGFGTPTGVSFFSRRVGDTLQIRGRFAIGTATATEARITLGFNGVNGGIVADPVKVPALMPAGTFWRAVASNAFYTGVEPSAGYIVVSCSSGGAHPFTKLNGDGIYPTAGTLEALTAEVPIQGWS